MKTSPDEALWFKTAIIYQLHVKAFSDSDADGMGDLRGLIGRLDYLADLGVTALWLLPFYPSPLRDDGYDISDYTSVHPGYGTIDDFKEFLAGAHQRGLRVITELVLNHTSDLHPWFQRARRAPAGSDARNFYVWSDTPDRYRDARIIFKDFERSNWTWDHVANAYYWHRFYAHQPDLNFDHPEVRRTMIEVLDYWFGLGVDGLRLDAVPYLFEREGTSCENLPETHEFLRLLRAHIDARYQNRVLLAEANMWPEDAVAYFGGGQECHMAFHFPLMPRMFMALQMEDRFPVIDILEQTPAIPANCQWAVFLRNHDELTLEMVTDEERDYMYRVYAADPRARINLGIRRRLAPLLGNSRRKMELMTTLLLSLPGTPVLYYGDEIGMGDNIYLGDRNGVRTPMQWSSDRNAGFSRANPQELYLPVVIDPEYHFEAVNVETQDKNLSAPLWWTRRVIAMRNKLPALGLGTMEFLLPDNPKVLAFVRRHENETILVLANLSRYAQPLEVDLSGFAGLVPVEVFSRNRFPVIKRSPYFFMLSPHGHYWFKLETTEQPGQAGSNLDLPLRDGGASLGALLSWPLKTMLEQRSLPSWLQNGRWFAGKAQTLRGVRIISSFPLPEAGQPAWIVFIEVVYLDAPAETYFAPMQIAAGPEAQRLLEEAPALVIARLEGGRVLHDALDDEACRASLFKMLVCRGQARDGAGALTGIPSRALDGVVKEGDLPMPSRLLLADQSNTSILYDGRIFLKLYRKVDPGVNCDAEMIRFLRERAGFEHVPEFYGTLEHRQPRTEPRTVGLLIGNVPHESNAWNYTLDAVGHFYEHVLEARPDGVGAALREDLSDNIYLDRVQLLGQRTGEMHLALASDGEDAAFAPEPFTTAYRRSLYQSMRGTTRRMIELVRRGIRRIPKHQRAEIAELAGSEQEILRRQARVLDGIETTRIRIHGDYHLGQVLNTGRDFVILDFEGEPGRSPGERRMKRSPLRDVAGMLRSLHYAAYASLWQKRGFRREDREFLEPWAEDWARKAGQIFFEAYLEITGGTALVPADEGMRHLLLDAFLLEKAAYEVSYELNNRPEWTILPARGIRRILQAGS